MYSLENGELIFEASYAHQLDLLLRSHSTTTTWFTLIIWKLLLRCSKKQLSGY